MKRTRLVVGSVAGGVGIAVCAAVWVLVIPPPFRAWEKVAADPVERQDLVEACRDWMADLDPGMRLTWETDRETGRSTGASPPRELAALRAIYGSADRTVVDVCWPQGHSTPTLFRGLLIYAEGEEPPGPAFSRPQEHHYVAKKIAPGLWECESQGDQ